MNEKGNFDHRKKKGKSFLFVIKKNSFVRIFFLFVQREKFRKRKVKKLEKKKLLRKVFLYVGGKILKEILLEAICLIGEKKKPTVKIFFLRKKLV